jgi:hypothetical protein
VVPTEQLPEEATAREGTSIAKPDRKFDSGSINIDARLCSGSRVTAHTACLA